MAENYRLLHHLARSGGTIICRCLATMRGVTLLSEINPRGVDVATVFDPLFQAEYWFKLLSPEQADHIRSLNLPFAEQIRLLTGAATAKGNKLVIRDWTHVDFAPWPVADPPYSLSLHDALAPLGNVLSFSTVRHPIAQWRSWQKYQPGSIECADFMLGCRRFAEQAVRTGFIRYEDFLADGGQAIGKICDALDLQHDPGFWNRWYFYYSICGDVGSFHSRFEIGGNTSRSIPLNDDEKHLSENEDYLRTLRILGYE